MGNNNSKNEPRVHGVVTYNLLTEKYFFPKDNISLKDKRTKHIQQITGWCKDGLIILLQEVCEEFVRFIEPVLAQYKYEYRLCHRKDGKHLSCMIAYPPRYTFNKELVVDISDTVKQSYIQMIMNTFCCVSQNQLEEIISKIKNRFICLILEDENGSKFCVSSIHMPRRFDEPDLMDKIARFVVSEIKSFANGLPIIIGGDFNSQPNSGVYEIMTESFEDAYLKIHQKHPKGTNCSKQNNPIVIDYIFVRNIEIIRANKLSKLEMPIPGKINGCVYPSDHWYLLIYYNMI